MVASALFADQSSEGAASPTCSDTLTGLPFASYSMVLVVGLPSALYLVALLLTPMHLPSASYRYSVLTFGLLPLFLGCVKLSFVKPNSF